MVEPISIQIENMMIRKLQLEDALYIDDIFNMSIQKEIAQALVRKMMNDEKEDIFVIYVEQHLVGMIELIKKEECIEIGYRIGKHYQNNGYGKQAIKSITLALETKGLELTARVSKENQASIKLLEYSGYQMEKEDGEILYYRYKR